MVYFGKKDLFEKGCYDNCVNYGLDCYNCCRFNPWTHSCGRHKTFTIVSLDSLKKEGE